MVIQAKHCQERAINYEVDNYLKDHKVNYQV